MTPAEIKNFETIKEKIETLKTTKAKSEGALEALMIEWKEKYGFASIDDAQAWIDVKTKEMQVNEDRRDALYVELKSLHNWGMI